MDDFNRLDEVEENICKLKYMSKQNIQRIKRMGNIYN